MPTIGDYSLHTVETGRFGLDGGAMFGIVPKPLWEKQIPPDERNRIPLHMRCLLLESTDRLILIDTGIGDKFNEKFRDIYAIDYEQYSLKRSLEALNVPPSEVTDVILTHLHFDHCGGTSYRKPNGELALTFENAQHHVQRRHWEWARASNPKEEKSFLDENLEPLASGGQLDLVDGRQELLPGVEVIPVHGHTEGQQIVKISDGDKTLVFVADLLPTTAHLPAAWTMAYDIDPLATIKEKEVFLQEAADENWHLFFEHDPEVAVANVERTDRGITTVNTRSLEEL